MRTLINRISIPFFISLFLLSSIFGNNGSGIQASGYFNLDLGNIQNGTVELRDSVTNEWFYGFLGGVTVEKKPLDNLRLRFSVETRSFQVYPLKSIGKQSDDAGLRRAANWRTYLEEGFALYTIGGGENPFLEIEGGFFIHKYNPDAKVLGEYLFRSTIYPTVVNTKFNYAQAQIFGLRLGNHLGESFHHDLFVQMEREPLQEPYYDISLAYLAGYKVSNILEFGGGIRIRSAIPVKPSQTTPENKLNTYYRIPAQTVIRLDSAGLPMDTIDVPDSLAGVYNIDEVGLVNFRLTRSDSNVGYEVPIPELVNKRIVYSFQGTLLMGRVSFNPMGFSESLSNLLGGNAFKLYFEAAVLGWKNYPRFYDDRRERIPVMFGLGLPTFNLIDDLNFEVEHLPLDTLPSFGYRGTERVPLPGQRGLGSTDFCGRDNGTRCTEDDWKWVLYGRKQFPGFDAVLQVGSDHMKRENVTGNAYDDIFTRPSQWYWQVRFTTAVKDW